MYHLLRLALLNGSEAWPIAATLNRRYLTGIRAGRYCREGPKARLQSRGCSKGTNC